jgi:hypothetical protein
VLRAFGVLCFEQHIAAVPLVQRLATHSYKLGDLMSPASDKLSRVNEHSLPYRVLIEEIAKRRPDILPANVEAMLDTLDGVRDEVARCERLDEPNLEQYRMLLKKCAAAEALLKAILHEAKLSAICFSGGGIRSASFGLGVLTGLAELSVDGVAADSKGVLKEIDYVSTVSGGGYLGSWFTGWIHRHPGRLNGVLNDLTHYRLTSADPEAPAVRHLRDYTSYLAPRSGLLSPDSWTLAAIVLRNLLLNWAILVPTFAALLLLPILNSFLLSWTGKMLTPNRLLIVAAALAFFSLLSIGLNLPGNFKTQPRNTVLTNYAFIGLPLLVLAAWCLSAGFLGAYSKDEKFDSFCTLLLLWLLAAVAHAGLLVARVVVSIRQGGAATSKLSGSETATQLGKQFTACLGASLFSGWLFWLLANHGGALLLHDPKLRDIRLFTGIAVPIVLGVFALTGVLVNGLSAKFDLEEDREWWSRAAAFVLMATVLWPLAHLLVLFNKEISDAATYVFFGKVKGTTSIPALAGIIGAIASWAGFTPATPSASAKVNSDKLSATGKGLTKRDLLLPALGVTFFVVLGVALAQANNWLIRWAGKTPYPDNLRLWAVLGEFAGAFLLALIMNSCVSVNTFSLHGMYRSRLVRSYLGASNNKRRPNPFTNFDVTDNLALASILAPEQQDSQKSKAAATPETSSAAAAKTKPDKNAASFAPVNAAPTKPQPIDVPLHVINIALNVVAGKKLAWQQRKAESFTASPLHCGSFRVGYRPTAEYAGTEGITLGTAMAISGAAASPNMGYHSSPMLSLVMTFFNARLGWWLPNPGPNGKSVWGDASPRFSLAPLLNEALGQTTDENKWVYLSDGGHFENLGLYEMVMRRCKRIIVVDGGCDLDFKLEDLGNAVRKIQIDLGVSITFDPAVALERGPAGANQHRFIGRIRYSHCDLTQAQLNRLRELERCEPLSEAELKEYGELSGHRNRDSVQERRYQQLKGREARKPEEEAEYQKLVSADGVLVYIKASLNGNEPADVTQYYKSHDSFPHESTANQFFNESQFQSYVRLGMHVVDEIMHSSSTLTTLDKFIDAAGKK